MDVNQVIFENKWEQIRAQTKVWWSLFTDEEFKKVEEAPIKLDKYSTRLRMKYGYTHERTREKIHRRIAGQEANEFKHFPNPEENIETAFIFYHDGSVDRTSLSDRISA